MYLHFVLQKPWGSSLFTKQMYKCCAVRGVGGGGYFYDDFDRAGRCLQFFSYQQCLSVPCCVAVLSDVWRGSAEP